MRYTVEVSESGPLFNGRLRREIIPAFLHDAKEQIGGQALANWHHNMETSFRHPTPYYETQTRTYWHGEEVRVDDRGVVYGPWLEGVGSRNSPVTRFPGYRGMRRAVETLMGQIPALLERLARIHFGGAS